MNQETRLEQLLTLTAITMQDIRGSWGGGVYDRCELITTHLKEAKNICESNEGEFFDKILGRIKEDLEFTETVMEDDDYVDGRIFRNCCYLYGYVNDTPEVCTKELKEAIEWDLEYPENFDYLFEHLSN